jgi:hypothetical protein
MTAGERLSSLAGTSGTAGALLMMIGTGTTAGEYLVSYSGLGFSTAAASLLFDRPVAPSGFPSGGAGGAGSGKVWMSQRPWHSSTIFDTTLRRGKLRPIVDYFDDGDVEDLAVIFYSLRTKFNG